MIQSSSSRRLRQIPSTYQQIVKRSPSKHFCMHRQDPKQFLFPFLLRLLDPFQNLRLSRSTLGRKRIVNSTRPLISSRFDNSSALHAPKERVYGTKTDPNVTSSHFPKPRSQLIPIRRSILQRQKEHYLVRASLESLRHRASLSHRYIRRRILILPTIDKIVSYRCMEPKA